MITISRTIYIDILIGTNVIINYFIILAVEKFTGFDSSIKRKIVGSVFGAICSLVIFLPEIPFFINLLLKLVISSVIILLTFGYHNIKAFIKNISLFYFISFCFCGAMLFIWFIFTPRGMVVKNSVVYFNISPIVMIITTIFCYLVIRFISKITEKQSCKMEICKIKLINNDRYCEFYGKIDTGNTLCEPFSQTPVIVVNENAVKEIAEEEFEKLLNLSEPESTLKNKYRLIPFTSVGGKGLLPAFVPREVYINNTYCRKKVYVAVCKNNILNGEIKAMINPEIIEYVKDDCNDINNKTL